MAVSSIGEEVGAAPELAIGSRIRSERKRRGLTLQQLGSRLNLSPSAISQIERGRSRPSVSTLYAIVNELDLSLDDLFAGNGQRAGQVSRGAESEQDASVVANFVVRGEARQIFKMESGVEWARLNPVGDHEVEFREVTYEVGGASSVGNTYMRHTGREYGLVLAGTLRVTIGETAVELDPGDSVCFDSHIPHRLATVGTEPVKAVWFVVDSSKPDPGAHPA